MTTITKQVSFQLPEDILNELNLSFSKSQQNKIVAEAIRKELKRLKLQNALYASFGAWKDKDHLELKSGVNAHIRSLRKSSREKRIA